MVIFRARRANSKNYFQRRNRIEIPSGLKIVFWTEKAPLSALVVAGFMKYAGQLLSMRGEKEASVTFLECTNFELILKLRYPLT